MNILILVTKLSFGGAERVASLWANGFANNGHNVSVCTCRKKSIPDSYSLDPKIQRYDIYNFVLKVFYHFGIHYPSALVLRKIIKKIKPDVIICVQGYWAKWAFTAARNMNIPIINTDHNAWERPDYAPMPKISYQDKFVDDKNYNAVTVLTDADKKCIGDTLKNVFVLPNPLTYSPVKTIPPKDKIILAVGRFNAWHCKGFDLLIKAWGKIASENSDWKLYIAGTGNTESINYLKQLAEDNKVSDSIVFPGFVEMLPLYQKASIFVLSSRYEGFGMVLTEAMSQGCACIACDYKGRQSEIITSGNEGITIPVDDIDAIATAINKLTHDDVLRRKLQLGGIERSHFFSIENTMERWNKILLSVVKQ
jgi:glycosyltransferase involved in cell wall biosynthesis